MKRALSLREISRCEEAREPVCKCRCQGALHGAKRGTGAVFFAALPADDPHHYATKQERQERAKREREEKAQRRYAALAEIYSRAALEGKG